MEELKNGTLNQEQPEQTQDNAEQQSQEQPEVFLDEDGNLVASDDVLGVSGDTGNTGTENTGDTDKTEQKYYTAEEMQKIGLDKLDPDKIPPELIPFYKSMQADYTRKTQAVAEERKIVEKILSKALQNPEIAKDILDDEVVAFAQKHPDLAVKLQNILQQAQQTQQNPIVALTEQAKSLVEQELGEPFDEFNPAHMTALTLKVQDLQREIQKRQAIHSKLIELQQKEPHFADIDKYAEEKLYSMPYREAMKIQQAIQNGDIETLLNFWEECRKEWYNLRLQKQQSQNTQPPVVEHSGHGDTQIQPQITPEAFASAGTLEDKAKLLEKLGLV